MSRYLVKSNQTNAILTVIEWDGLSPIYSGSNYILELETTASYSGSFAEPIVNISGSGLPFFNGEFDGIFSGELTGSITINGLDLKNVIETTEYGYLSYFSGSDSELINTLNGVVINSSSYFAFNQTENPTEIVLLNASPSRKYSSSLSRIIDENISNYIFKLKDFDTPSFKEYLVSDTQLLSSNDIKYTVLTVNELMTYTDDYYYSGSLINYGRLRNSQWHIDFDLRDKSQAGTFYGDLIGTSGSFNNVDISGSLILNGIDIGEAIKTTQNNVRYTLRYSTNSTVDEYFYDRTILNVPLGTTTVRDNIFRTDVGSWNAGLGVQHTATLPISLFGVDSKGVNLDENFYNSTPINPAYHDIMFNIIKYGLQNITVKIEKKADANVYKTFRIDYARILTKLEGTPDTFYLTEPFWYLDQNTTFNSLYSYQYAIVLPGLKIDVDNGNFVGFDDIYEKSYIELSITNLDSSAIEPNNLDECWIYFDLEELQISGNRREIAVYEHSDVWSPPNWLNKLTVHCIGAGGGGGGGAAGVKHKASKFSMYGFNRWLNYDPTQAIGHEIVFGGGGGSGGNVASKTYYASELKGNYDIIVGSGGRKGKGITYQYHTSNRNDLDFYPYGKYPLEINRFREQLFILKRENPRQSDADLANFDPTVYSANSKDAKLEFILTYPVNPLTESEYTTKGSIMNSRRKYDGQDGGFSSFSGKNVSGRTINVVADGGVGGQTGTALKAYYQPYHYICTIGKTFQNTSGEHAIPKGYIFGGGSRKGNTNGDRILLGGPGGYGISMAYWEQGYDGNQSDGFDYKKIYSYIPDGFGKNKEDGKNGIRLYKNTAPSLPWGYIYNPNSPWINPYPVLFEEPNPPLPDLKLPYGSVSVNLQIYGILGYYQESPIKPSYAAPTGGGGGTGKQFAASTNDFIQNIKQPDQDIPKDESESWYGASDWGTRHVSLLDKFTTLGKGGQNLQQNYLDNMPSDNTLIGVAQFGLGGNGGYDSFLHPEVNSQPEDGAKYGGGGGGGAGIYGEPDGPFVYGQDGGNGGDGAVVLVMEGDADFDILQIYYPT